MRRAQDLPVDRPRRRVSGRGILIALGGLFMFVLIFGRAIARFYVDFLWHDALGRGDVFWGVIGAKFTLFALFFAGVRGASPASTCSSPTGRPRRRSRPTCTPTSNGSTRCSDSGCDSCGTRRRWSWRCVIALPAVAQWQEWLLFRNAKQFGVADPQFGADVGFYVFQLPFLTFLLDWLFVARHLGADVHRGRAHPQRWRRVRLAGAGDA